MAATVEFSKNLVLMQSELKSIAFRFTRNKEDAEDLVQETMLRAITYRNQFVQHTNLKAWVYTLMRSIFINQYRRKKKSASIFDFNKDFQQLYQYGQSENQLSEIAQLEIDSKMKHLDQEYMLPFKMYFDGFLYKEIANSMNIPIGTVKSRIFMARKKLMDSLTEYHYLAS